MEARQPRDNRAEYVGLVIDARVEYDVDSG